MNRNRATNKSGQSAACLAIVMVLLWLGGVGCVTCCAIDALVGCCTSLEMSCGPSQSSDDNCCKASKTHSSANEYSISRRNGVGCSLLPKEVEGLLDRSDLATTYLGALPVQPLISIDGRPSPGFSRFESPANRGSTYLRCCVLLI
jgi:hypothetical protein